MDKAYNRVNGGNGYVDFPLTDTPLNAENMNKIDYGLSEVDDRVIRLDQTKASKLEIGSLIQHVEFNEKNGTFTFYRKDGTLGNAKIVIDTFLEKVATDITFDPERQKLILILNDDPTKTYEIDLKELVTQREFLNSETISFSIKEDGKVESIVREGSIQEKHLNPNYLAEIKLSLSNARLSAKESESFAHGNTGLRPGEETDNSEYYSNQAKEYSNTWRGSLLPKGTILFSALPSSGNIAGHMYNVNQSFVTDSRFKDGEGFSYPSGTNVYWTSDGKWDCLSGTLTKEVTQAEYDALTREEQMSGTIYYISDSDDSIPEGGEGVAGIVVVDSELSTASKNPVQNRVITNSLMEKVDKVPGKVLSTNDYTNEEKEKLSGIETGANVNVQPDWNETDPSSDSYIKNKPLEMGGTSVDSELSPNSTNAIQNKVVYNALEGKLSINGTAKKAEALSNTSSVGSTTNPVFFNDSGKPEECSGIANFRQLTQSDYDSLPSIEKMNGTIYFITDAE